MLQNILQLRLSVSLILKFTLILLVILYSTQNVLTATVLLFVNGLH